MMSCNGKTALVIDGADGIGRAATLALARAGAQVLVHHCRSTTSANQVVSDVRSFGGKAEPVSASLAEANGAQELARKTRAIVGDRLDVLVLNSAPFTDETLAIATADAFDAQLVRNVRAPLMLVQHLLPILTWGSSIVFTVTPSVGHDVAPGYVSTRGAVSALVPHLAATLGARGVRVNAVASGSATQRALRPLAKGMSRRAVSPAYAPGTYDGIAAAIAFLASESARAISGGTLSGQLVST